MEFSQISVSLQVSKFIAMILNIENLGVVKKAQIDLSKKFIVFCGKNNTGKTYTSYILQAFLTPNGVIHPQDCYKTIFEQLQTDGTFKIKKEYIDEWLAFTCGDLRGQIGNIFGISDVTSKKLFNNLMITAEYSEEDYMNSLNDPIDISMKDGNTTVKIKKNADSDIVSLECNPVAFDHRNMRAWRYIYATMYILAFRTAYGARMLTVERNSIYTFKTELSLSRNELIDKIQQQANNPKIDILDIVNSSSRRYPQPIRDSLRIANDLSNVQKYVSPYSEIADIIETKLLQGKVDTTKEGEVEFHADGMSKTKRLPFHMSSSIVKTMASLVIYLRHIAGKGETLIIDEPEMNFHPNVQVWLARIFALLSAKGLRIIVSTHSDYIVRELNSLIMGGTLLKKGIKEPIHSLGYNDDMLLDYADLSVLFFSQTGKGNNVTVKSLPIDDEGFTVESIDETILEQNKRVETLYAVLENSLEQQ